MDNLIDSKCNDNEISAIKKINELTPVSVSFYNNVKEKNNKTIDINEVINTIRSGIYQNQIEAIRTEKDKEKRNKLKLGLPAITVSGTFNGGHSAENLINHSGFIQIDIDNLKDVVAIREKINADKHTYTSFISPSGSGIKVIIKISADKEKHLEYFLAIQNYYNDNFDIQIDKACKDVSRLMYLSADSNLYINADADIFLLPENIVIKENSKKENVVSESNVNKVLPDVEKVVLQIEERKIDITNSYDDWLKIGFALSDGLGEAGRTFYHRVSFFNSGYNEINCNEQFNKCLKHRKQGITIKSFFQLCKEHSIDIKPVQMISDKPEKIKEKKIKSQFAKVEDYLKSLYDIRYNEVANVIEFRKLKEDTYKELNENNVYRTLQHNFIKFSMANLLALLRSEFVPIYNPIKKYFNGLPAFKPEKEPDYIDLLAKYILAKDEKRFAIHFKKWLVRSIACALEAESFNKQALILVSEKQNTGKSTFCRWLCPKPLKDYFAENISTDKDSQISLSENFIINLDELATLSKLEINALKSMFSKIWVKIRRPYDKRPSIASRIANFIGSTNKNEFLSDETGSVRWLCFEISGINFNYMKDIDVNLVWAQAYHLYKAGFKYELTADEVKENELENKKHFIETEEMQLIKRFFSIPTKEDYHLFVTTSEILAFFTRLGFNNNKMNVQNIGKAMSQLEWLKGQELNKSKQFQKKGYYINVNNSDHKMTLTNIKDGK